MKKIFPVGRDVKGRRAGVKGVNGLDLRDLDMDIELQLIQELIALGLIHVASYREEY